MVEHSRQSEGRGRKRARALSAWSARRSGMCPVCVSATALLVGGFTSTGGVAVLLARLRLKLKRKTKKLSGG